MANQDRVNFIWAESALTTIPPIPVSEVAYRDTTQTPEQMEVGQQYDTIYNSARHNQLLFLLTSVAKTLCENGIMPFLAGQEYSQYARCIFTDGKLYKASRAILANEQPYPTPGDDSGVWIAEETSENLVPNSRRVIAGTGLTGGGPLSSDVTLSAKLDGKTTQADAGGVITAKDVAIGGDLGDLASARGQIGELKVATATEYPSILTIRKSCRLYFNGTEWAQVADRPFEAGYGAVVIADVSSGALRGEIWAFSLSGNDAWKAQFNEKGTSPFARFVMSNAIGDGIRVTNGIISVPEYDGATASTSGTSGLVPPATAGQQESFLTGGGEYKPALTKISDSVSLEDSTTAASAKAVKTAYDLASAALPKSGGTISGNISVVGGITVAAPDGKSEGGQILLKNGTDGSYPVVIDTTQNQIRFLSGPGGPGGFVSVDLETVRFVGNLTGKADSAHLADNTYSLAGRPWLEDLYTDSPGWVIGSVDEQLRPINTGSLKVLAADRIISGSFAYGRASDGFYLPNGGSWFVFCILDNDVSHGSANAIPIIAAGGSHITWSFNGTGYTWIGIKVL